MTNYRVASYDPIAEKLGIPQGSDGYLIDKPLLLTENLTTTGEIDGRDIADDGGKLDLITVVGSHDLDTRFTQVDALQTKLDFATITQAVDLDAMETKQALMTVTQPVDLDAMELRINALDASVVLMGTWDATTGLFPTSTVAGESWICSVSGTVAGVVFTANDRIVALIDGASNAVYTGNWHHLDYNDEVLTVAGRTGAVVLVEADITDLQSYMLPADIDTLGKLNTIVGESLMTIEQLDTLAELNALVTDGNFLANDGSVATAYQDFTPAAAPAHLEGRVFYDSARGTLSYYVDEPDITMNIGEENWVHCRNDTGVTIADGTPVYISGAAGGIPQITKVVADGERCVGLTTHSIETGTVGHITTHGTISGPDLTSFSVGDTLYISDTTPGLLVNVAPNFPSTIIEVGIVLDNSNPGSILVDIEHHGNAYVENKSYNFSARTATSGEYFLGGFYDYNTADANLTQASTTVTHGSATNPYAAHAFMVFGAASTDGTNVTLTASGTSFTDAGVRTPGDSEVLYTGPVAGLTLNDYYETSKKFLGTVTFTLTSDGVNFTMDFNYGYAKYEDFHNRSFILRAIEFVGLADASDAGFDLEVLHHDNIGWTYSAAAFQAGGVAVAIQSTDHGTESDLVAGEPIAWKRSNLAHIVAGAASEGLIIRVTTTTNNCIAYLNGHITVTIG